MMRRYSSELCDATSEVLRLKTEDLMQKHFMSQPGSADSTLSDWIWRNLDYLEKCLFLMHGSYAKLHRFVRDEVGFDPGVYQNFRRKLVSCIEKKRELIANGIVCDNESNTQFASFQD